MGVLACETLQEHSEFDLVAKLSSKDNLAQAIRTTQAQIVVDLTRADCVYENTLTIIEHNACPVIGTSGLLPKQIDALTRLAKTRNWVGL